MNKIFTEILLENKNTKMGGSFSKERTFTYYDMMIIPRETILNHWIKEDEDAADLIDAFINAKFFGIASEHFPNPNVSTLMGKNSLHEDQRLMYLYKDLLKKKIISYQRLCQKEKETTTLELQLESILEPDWLIK